MRWLAVIAFAGCASGGAPASPDADVGGKDGPPRPDAATCGEGELLPCNAVYVAPFGADTNVGDDRAPLKTIGAAIEKASAQEPPAAVIVQAGRYAEQIVMAPGVDVLGGFDETWTRNPAVDTSIEAASPAVRFEAITVPTRLDGVTVKSADATAAGDSSTAIVVIGSMDVELVDVEVQPGIGAAGADGDAGTGGANGNPGATGKPGVERSGATFCDENPLPTGGAGGTSVCGRTGGTGGTPGTGSQGGGKGGTGAGGTAGGAGGCAGTGGTAGSGGGGSFGVIVLDSSLVIRSSVITASRGGDGGRGGTGGGGGSGGPGGPGGPDGGDSEQDDGGFGAAGGRGGNGGRGGHGGGGGGGPSVAVACVGSSQVTIPQTMLVAGTGGTGGGSSGHAGTAGTAANSVGCSFF